MKLYIGNLPFSISETEIREMLEEYGTLQSFDWITDRDTGRPRGFCFAEMDNSEADTAIKALNGKDLGGRNLKINEARARNDRRKKRSW
ncbi:MAG TPA: RNA-binding protein [Thermodesulfobacteriaceae bacterium]|nr:RNA-binding protein [Thermodesulfobacteriaceae bacterium]